MEGVSVGMQVVPVAGAGAGMHHVVGIMDVVRHSRVESSSARAKMAAPGRGAAVARGERLFSAGAAVASAAPG
jgi:hypothetical protein